MSAITSGSSPSQLLCEVIIYFLVWLPTSNFINVLCQKDTTFFLFLGHWEFLFPANPNRGEATARVDLYCVYVFMKAMALKITCIVQSGHPENILEKDGTFFRQEALLGKGKARLSHTHTHPHLKACEPEMGDCLARADRWIQRFPRFSTCRRSQLCSQSRCGSLCCVCGILETSLTSFHSKTHCRSLQAWVCACG